MLLAGLIPPKSSSFEIWSNITELGYLWQPIGVESVERMLSSETHCPKARYIERMINIEQPVVKKFLENHQKFIKQLELYSGEDYHSDPRVSWYNVGYLWDTLFTEKEYFGYQSFNVPHWLDLVGNDTWDRLYKFNEVEIGAFNLSPQYQRLRAGPFLKEIITNMNTTIEVVNNHQDKYYPQLFTYSSHDTMISYILQALGFWKGKNVVCCI